MSEVKTVISVLCRLLNKVFAADIKAEHFRLAKFNKTDDSAVTYLWNVLHKLCCSNTIDTGKGNVCKGKNNDIVTCVKLYLTSHNYNCFTFHCLPHDMSTGSRELLLAFGWLLAETNILELRIMNHVNNELFRGTHSELSLEISSTNYSLLNAPKTNDNLYNYIIWLCGRINQNLKAISSLTDERLSLNNKVHCATKDACGLPYLTVKQLMLLKKKEALVDNDTLKCIKVILENYFYFVKHKKIFWDWMESVLSEETKKANVLEVNKKDFNTFIGAFNEEIRNKAMYDPFSDYSELRNYLKANVISRLLSNQDLVKCSKELSKETEQLNSLYNNYVSSINDCIEEVRISCNR